MDALAWILPVLLILACFTSLYACSVAFKSRATVRDECERISARIDSIERSERLTPTKQAELAEFADAMARAEQLLKTINQREVMRSRRGTPTRLEDFGNDKDALRRRAGLIAGRPAPHQ